VEQGSRGAGEQWSNAKQIHEFQDSLDLTINCFLVDQSIFKKVETITEKLVERSIS